jgi:hypothetical protein
MVALRRDGGTSGRVGAAASMRQASVRPDAEQGPNVGASLPTIEHRRLMKLVIVFAAVHASGEHPTRSCAASNDE